MHLEERHISDLNKIVDTLSKIHGVIGVILFGSLARGDYDAYSDYDLLVLFEDKVLMWQNWDELFLALGNLKMHLHVIPQTLEELEVANPVFLQEIFTNGKILFAKTPLEVFPKPVQLKTFCLIIYDMSKISYKEKMKVTYLLYRKEGTGIVAKVGGVKLKEGCLLVPNNTCNEIVDKLTAIGVRTRKLEVFTKDPCA
jgi:predicted nucleotidyltransferase